MIYDLKSNTNNIYILKTSTGLYLCSGSLAYFCKFRSVDKKKYPKEGIIKIKSCDSVGEVDLFIVSSDIKVIEEEKLPGNKIPNIRSFLNFLNMRGLQLS